MNEQTGRNRPKRREYRELFASLPEDRQDAHLRTLLVWLARVTRQPKEGEGQGALADDEHDVVDL